MKAIIKKLTNKKQFAEFLVLYKESHDNTTTPKTLKQLEQDWLSKKLFGVIVAYLGKEPMGFMMTVPCYSSTRAQKTLYLEEFYVGKKFRRQGFGRQLFSYLINFAQKNSFLRIEWSTYKSNKVARAFYKKYKATEHIFYKLKMRLGS